MNIILILMLLRLAEANGKLVPLRTTTCEYEVKVSVVESHLIDSTEQINTFGAAKKLTRVQLVNGAKYAVAIQHNNDSKKGIVYTPMKPKNNNISIVYESSLEEKNVSLNYDEIVSGKYSDIAVTKKVVYQSNFSIWPLKINCNKKTLDDFLKNKNSIDQNEFSIFNLNAVKYKGRNDVYFVPPSYIVVLDIKNNWCANRICDMNKKMKILSKAQKNQIMIDDEMNLYYVSPDIM